MQAYRDKMHFYGRIFVVLGILMMFLVPVVTWIVTGVGPDVKRMIIGVGALSVLFLPGGVIEVLTYGPILGTSGTYLAFITGNLVNLKVPCAMNASQLAKTKINTEENEIVSTISIAASTTTTITIMVLGVLMLVPLRPFLESEMLAPAFNWVVSALFGALSYKYIKGHLSLAVVPLLFVVVLALVLPVFVQRNVIVVVVLAALITIGFAWYKFKNAMNKGDLS